jgi:hypothetical protein
MMVMHDAGTCWLRWVAFGIAWAALTGCVVAIAVRRTPATENIVKLKWLAALFAIPASLLCGYWAYLALNAKLDGSPPVVVRAQISDLGKWGVKATHYEMEVVLVDQRSAPRQSTDIDRKLYETLTVGDEVLLTMRPGAFGQRWAEHVERVR